MRKSFQPDLFSSFIPEWHPLSENLSLVFRAIEENTDNRGYRILSGPKQSGAFGINSSNFKLYTTHGIFLLKRWGYHTNLTDMENVLATMSFLSSESIPVPRPAYFRNGKPLLLVGEHYYSLFSFVKGEYFSGDGTQLESAARAIGRFMQALKGLPSGISLGAGPAHLTLEDDTLLMRVGARKEEWADLFVPDVTNCLRIYWDDMVAEWRRLMATRPDDITQPAHFDLHPHNLLFSGDELRAVLDFESCKLMQPGYALGFAGLKLCRQVMVRHSSNTPLSVGDRFLNELVRSMPGASAYVTRFNDYAMAEVLRRVCLILRLNYERHETTWNRVLPIQLGHIDEIRKLFS